METEERVGGGAGRAGDELEALGGASQSGAHAREREGVVKQAVLPPGWGRSLAVAPQRWVRVSLWARVPTGCGCASYKGRLR